MATASDVPRKFDVVINGQGYLNADSQDLKAEYSYTPTFIPRQNVQGDYGDNQQDFFQAATQRDWSLGEQQEYYRSTNEDSRRRYWTGSAVDVTTKPGRVAIRGALGSTTFAATPVAAALSPIGLSGPAAKLLFASSTKLMSVDSSGTEADLSTHGLGGTPSIWGLVSDGAKAFLTCNVTDNASSVGVRQWNGSAYSTFSATSADSLAYLNNTLYGLNWANGQLIQYSTGGTGTTVFTWKDSAGAANRLGIASGVSNSKIVAYGGKLAILIVPNNNSAPTQASLWFYDGTAPAIAMQLPLGFKPYDMIVSMGVLFISGVLPYGINATKSSQIYSGAIFYYSNGTFGRLWVSDTQSTTARYPSMVPWQNGILFADPNASALLYYDSSFGGVQTVSTGWTQATTPIMAASDAIVVGAFGNTSGLTYQGSNAAATSATITTSLFDFDNSLTKLFRGIKVEFDSASDGNGGTVDISFRVGDVDGSYTSLQIGAASGTEYTLSGISGRSISVKVTLNKGTSTNGPVLKRITVRAAPQQNTFARGTEILKLEGATEWDPQEGQMMRLRNGARHSKDADTMAADLITAATAGIISITTITHGTVASAIIDLDGFKIQRQRAGGYVAVVPWRQV